MIDHAIALARLIALGAGLMLLAQVLASAIRLRLRLPLALLIVGAIARVIDTPALVQPRGVGDVWLDLLSVFVPFWLWLVGRDLIALPPPRRITLIAALLLVAAWIASEVLGGPLWPAYYAGRLAALALLADLARLASGQRAAVAPLLWLVLAAAVQTGLMLVSDLVFAEARLPGAVQAFEVGTILVLQIVTGIALMSGEAPCDPATD